MSIAFYNGEFTEASQVKIPLTDRSIFFGDGIYDAAIGKNGKIYLEDDHLERFIGNAEKLDIPLKFDKKELSELLHKAVQLNGYKEYFLYFQLSRHSEARTHSYENTGISNFLLTVTDQKLLPHDRKMKLITAPDIRYEMCHIKTLNLLPAVLASKKATDAGCDEVVFHRGSTVTECAHSNISIIKNGILYTHPLNKHILPGITRKRTLSLCKKLGIPYLEKAFVKSDLLSSDEVLVMSTTKLIKRASSINGFSLKSNNVSIGDLLIHAMYDDFENNCKI